MPERQKPRYVSIGFEAAKRRHCGLQVFVERLLIRILCRKRMCPFCRRVLEDEAGEKVIEF